MEHLKVSVFSYLGWSLQKKKHLYSKGFQEHGKWFQTKGNQFIPANKQQVSENNTVKIEKVKLC
jgi:hypothetical protein